jgi:hypothetical protein
MLQKHNYHALCSSKQELILRASLGSNACQVYKRRFNIPLYCFGLILFLDKDTENVGLSLMIVSIFLP